MPTYLDKLLNWVKTKFSDEDNPSWWTILKGMVFHTGGNGPSVTKGAYAYVCVVMGICMLAMVLTFCRVYLHTQKADYTFAGAISLVGGLFMGFATSAHKRGNTLSAETIQQQLTAAKPGAPDDESNPKV